jgi:hypothetical protein
MPFISAGQTSCLKQIAVFHAGMEDVHIEPLILATKEPKKGSNDFPDVILLTDEEFTNVERLIKRFVDSAQPKYPQKVNGAFGSFTIIGFDSCKRIIYSPYTPTRSKALFNFLLKNIKCFAPKNQERVKSSLIDRINQT